jgi:hypothetical protein
MKFKFLKVVIMEINPYPANVDKMAGTCQR